MKKILRILLVLILLVISRTSLKTSTNAWSGTPDHVIKKVHVIASNYRNCKHEVKAEREIRKTTETRLIISIGANILFIILLIAL